MKNKDEQGVKKLLDDVLKGSDIAWWEWDVPNNQVISNELKTTMLGYEPGSFHNAGYQSFTDLIHPDDYERAMQAMRDHLEGRASIYQIDYRIRCADGTYTWYMDRGFIIKRNEDGSPVKLRGIVVDLGETLREKSHDQAVMNLIRQKLPSSKDDDHFAVICSSCKNLKISKNVWVSLDSSFEKAFLRELSHGICPDCAKILYPDLDIYNEFDNT